MDCASACTLEIVFTWRFSSAWLRCIGLIIAVLSAAFRLKSLFLKGPLYISDFKEKFNAACKNKRQCRYDDQNQLATQLEMEQNAPVLIPGAVSQVWKIYIFLWEQIRWTFSLHPRGLKRSDGQK